MEGVISLLVIGGRLLIPFSIFRWPLAGAIASMIADAVDVMIFQATGYGYFDGVYHGLDKFLDTYYLFFELLAARRWASALARRTAGALFGWRFLGILIFELTGFRAAVFFAPNIFENFYLAWTIILKFAPAYVLTPFRLLVILLIVGIPKLAQEYVMHFKYPDQTWNFLRDHFFWWLYT